ncbi:MAG: hypothetical protein P4L49_02635 [Desulfosporosinus sp.]|nr:hypothetical protein [Desulfosporosinus sp.]
MGNLVYGTGPDNNPRELSVDLNGNVLTAQSAGVVTPSDSVNLVGGTTKGLYIGGAGNVSVLMQDGTSVTFVALAIGMFHNISVKRVNVTGTTATNILALY